MNKKIFLFIFIILIAFFISLNTIFTSEGEITIYSGRSENLIGPVFEKFTTETGIEVNVRYGGTAELAATILEEGENTPADIFLAQDAGGLGALAHNNHLQEIPENIIEDVDPRLKSPDNLWVGTSGRARVVSYNTQQINSTELPSDIWEFTKPQWEGRIGWAPTNGSFQAFITTFRSIEGFEKTKEWLEDIQANNPRTYENNTSIVDALGRGEVDIGFVNHYYLFRFLEERGTDFPVQNHHTSGDAGSMINIAGLGIIDSKDLQQEILQLIEFFLTPEIQKYFVEINHEYPVIKMISIDNPLIVPLEEINTPQIDLTDLEDLEGTLNLLREAGIL